MYCHGNSLGAWPHTELGMVITVVSRSVNHVTLPIAMYMIVAMVCIVHVMPHKQGSNYNAYTRLSVQLHVYTACISSMGH